MSSELSIASLLLFWKAHRAVVQHRENDLIDKTEDDPLKYHFIESLTVVPALLGVSQKFILAQTATCTNLTFAARESSTHIFEQTRSFTTNMERFSEKTRLCLVL